MYTPLLSQRYLKQFTDPFGADFLLSDRNVYDQDDHDKGDHDQRRTNYRTHTEPRMQPPSWSRIRPLSRRRGFPAARVN